MLSTSFSVKKNIDLCSKAADFQEPQKGGSFKGTTFRQETLADALLSIKGKQRSSSPHTLQKKKNQDIRETQGPQVCIHVLKECLASKLPLDVEKERRLPISDCRGLNKQKCARSDSFPLLHRHLRQARFCTNRTLNRCVCSA